MAFGDVVDSGSASLDYFTSSKSLSCSLAGTASANNLLIVRGFFGSNNTSAQIDTSGWTEDLTAATDLYDSSNTDWGIQGHKVAAGGESTVQCSHTATADEAVLTIYEYEGPFESSPVDVEATTAAASGTSISTGTTGTTAQADELAVAIVTSRSNSTATASWSNSFTGEGQFKTGSPPGTNGAKSMHLARKVLTSTGTVESTASSLSNVVHMGGVVTYKKQAVGGTTRRYSLGLTGFG